MITGGVAIGVDIGTSGARAALVDESGVQLALATAPIVAPPDDPRGWWFACVQALDRLGEVAALGAVRAIAVDGTSGTLLAVDAAGGPVAPGQMYHALAEPADAARVARTAPPGSAAIGPASPLAKALALQSVPRAARLLHQADWIAGQLCGRFDRSDANNALKTGYDPIAQCWPAWLEATGLRRALLPEVVAPGTPLAEITPDLAIRFSLPYRTRIVAGTTDGCASFLAAGARALGDGVTALGSSMVLKLACDTPIAAPALGVYSHRLGDLWLAGGASNTGGAALARHFDAAALRQLSQRIDPMLPSPHDYYPLPRPGERFPVADPELAPRETPRPDDDAAFLHGLLEGIARIEAQGYRRLAECGAPALRSVRTVGGGAANATWTEIRSRVLGVPVLPALSEEAAVGAAQLALGSGDAR